MTLGNAFISGVHQVALVVRNIDRALEEYTNRMGIGPWWVRLYAPPQLTDMRIRGKEIPYSMKLAIAWTGSTMWELIQPVDGPSIYKEFLDAHGEGLHHLQVRHEGMDFDTAMAAFAERGCPLLMEGRMGESQFAYLQTEGPLKTVLEIVKRPPDYVRPDPDYWYPAPPEPA
jgi:methylmalonyl-CoA/ethylmalonyl-CoA epimerase